MRRDLQLRLIVVGGLSTVLVMAGATLLLRDSMLRSSTTAWTSYDGADAGGVKALRSAADGLVVRS